MYVAPMNLKEDVIVKSEGRPFSVLGPSNDPQRVPIIWNAVCMYMTPSSGSQPSILKSQDIIMSGRALEAVTIAGEAEALARKN